MNICSRSLTDETAETDSENYIDFSQQKLQLNKFNEGNYFETTNKL